MDNNVRVSAIDKLAMNKGSATIVIVVLCLILVFALSGFAYSSDGGSSSYNNSSYGNSNVGNNNGYNGNNGLNNTPTPAAVVTTNAPVTEAPVTQAPITEAPVRVFSPLDTSDETIRSIETFGDALVMYQKIANDFLVQYSQVKKPGTDLLGLYEDKRMKIEQTKQDFTNAISSLPEEEFNRKLSQQEYLQYVEECISFRNHTNDYIIKMQNEQEIVEEGIGAGVDILGSIIKDKLNQ